MKSLSVFIFLLIGITLNGWATDPNEGTGAIKGHVTTSDGKPASEVSIIIKGTNRGVYSDDNGNFEFRK